MLFKRMASGCGGAGDSCDVCCGIPRLRKRFQAVVQCCKGCLTVHAWGWYSSDSSGKQPQTPKKLAVKSVGPLHWAEFIIEMQGLRRARKLSVSVIQIHTVTDLLFPE